ncbi:MAG: DUF4287 domain-containing protein [Anaerolineae bacterium]|nr:DUF4287 domain-containing protein [Anaerolineales bacterium]MCW5846757.1 DUF4287 domain-containing protein [Anaerolineae bacterium]
MNQTLDPATVTGTSSQAAEKATGKPWAEWMALLDAAGGRAMNHRQIVAHLAAHHDVSPWWQQQITVVYENSRGLRHKHEMSDGYQISRSRTIAASATRISEAWLDHDTCRRWLPDSDFSVRKAAPPKSIRLNWADGSLVEVALTAKGANKTTVTVQHNKLAHAEIAERMKSYWAAALERLQSVVESPAA